MGIIVWTISDIVGIGMIAIFAALCLAALADTVISMLIKKIRDGK
jgi:hypothetical protein